MATKTQTSTGFAGIENTSWAAGAVGGFVGSIIFGIFMMYVMPPPLLEVVVPAMYGVEGPALAAGWAIHQFHGVVLGLAYVGLVEWTPLRTAARGYGGAVGLGIGYGVLTTLLLAALVMPLWLSAAGFPMAPPFPNVAFPATLISTVGHIIYALPVTLGYALVAE